MQYTTCTEKQVCIQSVTLVMEEDVTRQITFTREGGVMMGVNSAPVLPYFDDALDVRKLTSVFTQLTARIGLKLQYDGKGGRIHLQLDNRWRGLTLGLCGTLNGNLRDDFLSPAGMIEGTPQLHANAWKVSSACVAPVNLPITDPCEMNLQNVLYASQCDVLLGSVFAPCHGYISPNIYQQQCRYQACRCGSSCLCTALAHYTLLCSKHGVDIDFRAHVSDCGVVCLGGMLYHSCVSSCGRSCRALSSMETCNPDDCAEGCGCPDGSYYDDVRQRCVRLAQCHCYTMAGVSQPGEVVFSASGPCLCRNGKLECVPEEKETDSADTGECPEGKVYHSCIESGGGMACAPTCRNLMLNVTCPPNMLCIPGCVCPPGLVLHNGECYYPENCPCIWLGRDYLPGETVETSCYKCVCHRGYFNCSYSPCPAVCTVYSDRHYHTFDGLEYDYHSDCQVYLVKSSAETEVSIVAQNKDCYESGIVCMKTLVIHVGLTKIYFMDNSGNPSPSTVVGRESVFELWKAGYYTVVYFPNQDLTILWDRKTAVHIKIGPQWKDLVSGLCGNFDGVTVNDMTTSSHMEVNNAQTFGDSWTLGQCHSDYIVERPCEADLGRQPYAKRECARLYSEVFAPCHNVVDVAWFYRNCLTDTCNCDRGGDCECLCTSIAAYAHKCCQQGVTIHWRSPSVCPQDCDYYNEGLGDGPYSLLSAVHSNTIMGVNRTSGSVFPLLRDSSGHLPASGLLFNFMVTAGLQKNKTSRVPVVSLESAERPNYFLVVAGKRCLQLEHWRRAAEFRRSATFILHQGLFLPGHTSFEVASQPGIFLTLTRTAARALRYDTSSGFKASSSFILEDTHFAIPYRMMCEWRYQACASPCVRTCSDPDATRCQFLPFIEGCFPRCPKNMVLDEVTSRCVYMEDCVTLPSAPTPFAFVVRPNVTTSPRTPASSTTTRPTTITTMTSTTTVIMTSTTKRPTTSATTFSTSQATPATTIPTSTTVTTTESLPILTPPTPASTILPPPSTTVTTPPEPPVPMISTAPSLVISDTTTKMTAHSKPLHAIMTTITPTETSAVAVATLPPIHSTSQPVTTQILTSPDISTTKEEETSTSAVLMATTPCTPPYVYRIDECAELICFNGQLQLYNASQLCHFNTTRPQCSLLGLPILINMDPCCPQWQCPCRCTVMSDLHVITFDGNNVALYDNGSYILVKLPTETITGTVEKCPTSQSVNSIRRPSPTGGTSGLCLKKLNITTPSDRIIINRLDRKVTVNYRPTRLPFSRHSLHMEDTGTMYRISTPGHVSIQWYHSTGIIVLQYITHNTTSVPTRGLCGYCDGNPENDLRLPNGTVVRELGDMMLLLHAWRVPTPDEADHMRRVGDNCTIGDCSICLYMLYQRAFTPCHSKVPPDQFCDIMWAGDLHYKDHQCDFLAAYVAICYTHQVCISWRRHNFCPLKCPTGKEYQPCVSTCASLTCLNRDYYDDTTCPLIREDCVCRGGTILHRVDSSRCVTEDQCACTDNEGNPRAPGDVWNGSTHGCCLYKCMDNGSVVTVEPDCSFVPTPLCERQGEYVLDVLEEGTCCPTKMCDCNMTICESKVPTCDDGDKLVMVYSSLSCCPEYRCECDPTACLQAPTPICREDQFLVEIRSGKLCCYSYFCVCESCIEPVPTCSHGETLAVDPNTTNSCCPQYHCVCDVNKCPKSSMSCSSGLTLVQTTPPGHCCPQQHCECQCEDSALPVCQLGEVLLEVPGSRSRDCGCPQLVCQKTEVCVFQGLTVLGPGQLLIQYFEAELCYTVHCLHHKDPTTGFYAMKVNSVNCSQQCGPNQVYVPSTDPQVCCGSCKNISCTFTYDNGTTERFAAGSSWVENCTHYDCVETAVGAMVLASGVVCPPFNDTECIQIGGVVQSYVDGCCKTCKEDGKTCKRVAIRTTIRKDDCRSNTPVTVFSCDGKCPSATIFNFNINSHARFCKCCRESELQSRSVMLYCTRNTTAVQYHFQEPMDCTCQWN